MAKGQHLSKHQQGIVKRYYRNLDTITVTKLAEIVSELALCEDAKKRDKLWDRAKVALDKIDANEVAIQKILSTRDIKGLAALVGELS